MTVQWDKCPAVFSGGKPYFYTAEINGRRWWVVWAYDDRTWLVEAEANHRFNLSVVRFHVSSIGAGKAMALRLACDYPIPCETLPAATIGAMIDPVSGEACE